MLREYAHYHPSIIRIIQYFSPRLILRSVVDNEFRKATKVGVWPFSVCDPLPKWSRGKILLIGDAAHPACLSSRTCPDIANVG